MTSRNFVVISLKKSFQLIILKEMINILGFFIKKLNIFTHY